MNDQIAETAGHRKLSIAIPASVVSDVPHLREKTSKIGLIGRAAAIFRVDEIIIFPDNPDRNQKTEINTISTLLRYLETPQYLRKKLFKLEPDLQYAGILPPLRTPHHPLNSQTKKLKLGELREAITLRQEGTNTLLDIGVEKPAVLQEKNLPLNQRVTVKITKIDKLIQVKLANRNETPLYWGYTTTEETSPLSKLIQKRHFNLVIATSKYGDPLSNVIQQLTQKWKTSTSILLAFGAPTRGLNEIAQQEGRRLNDIADLVVNTVPAQGTETIRTEEALIASLSILNFLST